MRVVLLFAVSLLLASAPLALAETTVKLHGPKAVFSPQLTCTTVFDAPGDARCHIFGPLGGATTVRVVQEGMSYVRVVVGDEPRLTQLTAFTCTEAVCTVTIPFTTTTEGSLLVLMTAQRPGASVHAHVAATAGG